MHQRTGICHWWLYLSAETSRKAGRLLIGVYEKNELIFAGKVGTGFDRAQSARLIKKLGPLEQKAAAFKAVPNLARRDAVWVKPKLVAQINFTEWTGGNSLRHPSYQGLREDKPANQVVREKNKRVVQSKQKNAA
jgi:bifunctional non-homologous end joining protein LigD